MIEEWDGMSIQSIPGRFWEIKEWIESQDTRLDMLEERLVEQEKMIRRCVRILKEMGHGKEIDME